MLADVYPMGAWKNLIEMEDSLTLEELYLLFESLHKTEYRRNKFLAAVNGIDLDEEKEDTDFFEIQKKAQAQLSGKSEQEYVFEMIGIEVEDDD
jgi:hypothetical protein